MATKQTKGLNRDAHLARELFAADKLKRVPTRDGYGEGLVDAGAADPNVVALCADLTESTRTLGFKKAFPNRFIQLGVSEQSMASIAAGLSLAGKIPFVSSYACFSPGRNWEQIRTTVALQNSNVKIAGAHAGVSVGPDGATHQMLEDVALMRVTPNMRAVVPCDAVETRKATVAVASSAGPAYLRFAREKTPVFTTPKTPFKLGRAEVYRFGKDATIVGAGPLLYEALVAAEALSAEHKIEVGVINSHTVKPLDAKTIVRAAKETGAVVTVEEAQAAGGLGGAVCELLAGACPVPVERIGMPDRFGESGEADQLITAFGLSAPYIGLAVLRAIARKRGERVPDAPEYVAKARQTLEAMRRDTIAQALARTPKKWGGKLSNDTLKSRAK